MSSHGVKGETGVLTPCLYLLNIFSSLQTC